MPSVCADECGLYVDGGSIALDWAAVGVKYGETVDSNSFTSTVPTRTDGMERARLVRSRFTNTTCRDHLVTYWAELPHLNMNMVPGNYWDAALYTTGRVGAEPSQDSFNLGSSARCRLSHPGGGQVLRQSWGEVRVNRRAVVPAGQTFHMVASFWRHIIDRADNAQNRLSWPSMALKWEAHPIG